MNPAFAVSSPAIPRARIARRCARSCKATVSVSAYRRHERASAMKVILLPGMGCTPVADVNWYSWFADEMRARNLDCHLSDFPDPMKCRESVWVPHVKSLIADMDDTILVGHSTGASCAMRLLEQINPAGTILVAAACTDLGDEAERESEYFSRPWDWETMKTKRNVVMFHGDDDPVIPVAEARCIKEKMGEGVDYREMKGKQHFWKKWPELLEAVDGIVASCAKSTSQ